MMNKDYNVVLDAGEKSDNFSKFLKEKNIYYEVSHYSDGKRYFALEVDDSCVDEINNFLENNDKIAKTKENRILARLQRK